MNHKNQSGIHPKAVDKDTERQEEGNQKTSVGVLLIHGFGGSPSEVIPLSEALDAKGYRTETPLLKGHERGRREMRLATRIQWIESAEKALESLKSECDSIILVGFSTGGLIATHLAQRNNIKAMVYISVPFIHWDLRRIVINLSKDVRTHKYYKTKWYMKSAIRFPLKSLIEFKILQHETKPLFEKITSPTLILQGKDDDTVHWKSANQIEKRLSATKIVKIFLNPAEHVMLRGPAAQKAVDCVLRFIEELDEGIT